MKQGLPAGASAPRYNEHIWKWLLESNPKQTGSHARDITDPQQETSMKKSVPDNCTHEVVLVNLREKF